VVCAPSRKLPHPPGAPPRSKEDRNLWITNYLESRTPQWRSAARYGFRNNALVLRIDNDQPTYYSDDRIKVSSIQTGQWNGLHKNNRFDHSIPTAGRYPRNFNFGMFKWADPTAQEIHHNLAVDFPISTEMHIYALEWTPTQMKLSVDNVLKKTMRRAGVQ